MTSTTMPTARAMRLVLAATATLLLALAALAMEASPAFAQDETLTVTKSGMGTVTSDPAGINCGDDCSEPYPSSEQEICIPNRGCNSTIVHQRVDLSAAPAPGWAFQSWSGGCTATATSCTVTVNEVDETVHATFVRVSPSNDDFANAQSLSGTNASVSGTTRDATRETGEPHHNAGWVGEHTVWYNWTAPRTGEWTLNTCTAAIDSILAVYTGSQLGSLTKMKDDNNGCGEELFGSKLTFRATANTTYRIVVGDAGGARESTFTLALDAIPAPSNDNFGNAQLMNGSSASVGGTNVSATRESSDPWSGEATAQRSVWYRWTAPYSGSVTLDTCTADYDSLLSVTTGRFSGLVNSANNGCPSGFGDKLSFNAQKDQTYYFGVDGCCGVPAGTFTLALNLVDDVRPETTIHSGPQDGSSTSNTSVTFAFDANEPDSTFECRVYRSGLVPPAFRACSGTGMHTESGLAEGTYAFEVLATDPRGNEDPSAATRTWTVDTSRPTIEDWGPTGKKVLPTEKPSVTFSEAMDAASVEASRNGKPTAFVLKKGRKEVGASVDYVETAPGIFTATLTPDRKLRRGATYTVSMTDAAQDEAGNALEEKSWKFRVKR